MTTLAEAAHANNFKLVRALSVLGCKWDGRTCTIAASNKNMAMLKYAHEHGCPLLSSMLHEAAKVGNIEAIKYGLDHGLECDDHVSWWASKYEQEHVMEWLRKNSHPIHSECKSMDAKRSCDAFFNE